MSTPEGVLALGVAKRAPLTVNLGSFRSIKDATRKILEEMTGLRMIDLRNIDDAMALLPHGEDLFVVVTVHLPSLACRTIVVAVITLA